MSDTILAWLIQRAWKLRSGSADELLLFHAIAANAGMLYMDAHHSTGLLGRGKAWKDIPVIL